jgi:hypothetical protein
MKWVPAVVWLFLPARTRGWGLIFLAISGVLSLVMLPLTIVQLQVLFGFGQRPFRFDYLVFVWSIVPWWWSLRHPFAFLSPRAWAAAAGRQWARAMRWVRAFRGAPVRTAGLFAARLRGHMRAYLGLDHREPAGRSRRAPVVHTTADIGD